MADYDDTDDLAEAIAEEAGAVKRCPNHDEIFLSAGDDEAKKKAYRIATDRFKGASLQERNKLRDAIKEVIDSAADECPRDGCRET